MPRTHAVRGVIQNNPEERVLNAEKILRGVMPLVYAKRWLTFSLLMLATSVLFVLALGLKPDAGYEKQIPLDHPYMQVFKKYEKAFGGANLISIALIQKDKQQDLYNEHFLDKLKQVTDAVFFLPGVDRSRVTSLFTPGVRYVEIVEDGFAGGDVIPRNYAPSPQMFEQIRANVAKAGVIGRLVSGDQRGALITAELLEHDPSSGERLDYRKVAQQMEDIRQKFQDEGVEVRIIGFAKVIGDVTDASIEVVGFFVVALLLTLALLWLFCGSLRLSLLPLSAALTAVVWELGLLRLAGFGLDPFAILVPFLILSIGVSHGVQYINGWGHEVAVHGLDPLEASRETFRRLFIPGSVAIITNVIGFATLAFIKIEIVQEMAINAALGMAAVIVTNKVLLPIVLTWVKLEDVAKFRRRQKQREEMGDRVWRKVADFATARLALPTLSVALLALVWAIWMYPKLIIGDQQVGVPELRPDSRYNQDSRAVAANFVIGVDLLKVIAENKAYGCVNHDTMAVIDRFAWHMQNTPGVQSVISLPQIAKSLNIAVHEGAPKWFVLPRNQGGIAHVIGPIPSSAGLQNPDCTAMPILIFTQDHRAATISRIVGAAKKFNDDNRDAGVNFALASGNVGVMAATNDEIKAREIVVIVWVHLTLLIFVWISFRSLAAVVCIITPLVLCSLLTYGGMATIGVGMKAATLPVAAFGVGIGVDDGIYLWSVLVVYLKGGAALREAYFQALRHTGKAVVFTSLSLIVAVFTWLFSELQFQADMGLLLLFMFTTNLFGAVLLLPALAWVMVQPDKNLKTPVQS
jgi:predicted RND superfamily exporter protein